MRSILYIMIAGAFSACDKEVTIELSVQSEEIPKVKTATYDSTVLSYTYDARGRQLTCDNSDGIKRVYAYPIGSIKESVYKNGVMDFFYKNDLNGDSLCVRELKSNDLSYEQLYQYNTDRTMAKVINKKNGSIIQVMDFFYCSGNCDSVRFIINGQWALTNIKEYYTDRPNVLGPEIFGNEYYGKGSINLLKSETFIYAGCSPESPTNYSYEYDAQGRVVKEVAVKGSNNTIAFYTYY